VKSHNPFAVNDIVFARQTGADLTTMNNYGCSLIWGHPQGPTGLRSVIELIEELVIRGGGRGLFQGLVAAGDSAMAVVIDRRPAQALNGCGCCFTSGCANTIQCIRPTPWRRCRAG